MALHDQMSEDDKDAKKDENVNVENNADNGEKKENDEYLLSQSAKAKINKSRGSSSETDTAVAAAKMGLGGKPKEEKEGDEAMDMAKYSEEDYALAEECIFKGYARKIERFGRDGKFSFEICTLMSFEMKFINEIVFDDAKDKDMSQQMISDSIDAAIMGATIVAVNEKEFPEDSKLSISLYKNSITRLRNLEEEGNAEEHSKQYDSVKTLLRKRMYAVYKMNNALRAVIGERRAKFETDMYDILKGDLLKNF